MIFKKQIIELWRRAINRKEITTIEITEEKHESREGNLNPDLEYMFTKEVRSGGAGVLALGPNIYQ